MAASESLTHVISTSALDDKMGVATAAAVDNVCPRITLQQTCLEDSSYPCVCRYVEETGVEVTRDYAGQATHIVMTFNLAPGVRADQFIGELDLMTGHKADVGLVSSRMVIATYNLTRPANIALKRKLQ